VGLDPPACELKVAIPTDVRDAVVGAYYPRALAIPDAARTRAQAGYAIASAIAAALVAAGVFGGLDERTGVVQALGLAALVAWLTAAGLYQVAVSAPFIEARPTQNTVQEFVFAALDAARAERERIDRWQERARVVGWIAAGLTVAALVSALLHTPSTMSSGTLTLTPVGAQVVGTVCGGRSAKIAGELDPDSLEKEFVTLTVDGTACGGRERVIAVPRSHVLAAAFEP